MKSMYGMMLELLRPDGSDAPMIGPERVRVETVIDAAGLRPVWEETRDRATSDAMHIDLFLRTVEVIPDGAPQPVAELV